MNKKILIPILIGVGIIPLFLLNEDSSNISSIPKIDFIYSNIDDMQKILIAENISMSNPTVISDDTVGQYCTYFDNAKEFRLHRQDQ